MSVTAAGDSLVRRVEVQVLVVLLIASLVGMFARRVRLPYTLALVLVGLGLSLTRLGVLGDLALTPELLLLLFLPPLLFEAAYHLPFEDLRRNGSHILFLAVAGVLISVGLTAVGMFLAFDRFGLVKGFGWAQAWLFAAVIAATDPISVLALFKELRAPKRLYQIVEGESLINDGVAVVVFTILSALFGVQTGQADAHLQGVLEITSFAVVTFLKTGLGGVLMGAAVGGLASALTRRVDDPLIEITFTTLVAWGSFLLAEEIHVSGVLSTVAAGIMMGSVGKRFGMRTSTRVAVHDFWQYMGFVSNSFIFLLIGLELQPQALWSNALVVSLASAIVVAARAALVYGGIPLIDRVSDPLPKRWRHVLVWGGLRGSLSMVLVLGLPEDFPGRTLLINLVFGVVGISLFVQGLTMAPLMRRLGMTSGDTSAFAREYDRDRGRALAYRQVLSEGEKQLEQGLLDAAPYARVLAFYREASEQAQHAALRHGEGTARQERLLEATGTLALIEREALEHAVRTGLITEGVGSELLADLNARLDTLNNAAGEGEHALSVAFARLYPVPPPPT